MKSLLSTAILWLALCLSAQAQPQCPQTPKPGTSNTMCANTAFVTKSATGLLTALCSTPGAFPIYNGTSASWVCSTLGGTGSAATISGGPLAINPTSASLNQGTVITQTGPASGSSVGPWNGNLINATFSSTVTGSGNPFFDFGAWQTWVTPHRVNFTVGGANLGGEPFGAGFYQLRLTTATAISTDFIGLAGEAYTNVAAAGAVLHGMVGAAIIDTGANIPAMNGLFSEVDIVGTATVAQRRGVHVVSQGVATATGAIDTAYDVASSATGASFKRLMVINTSGGAVSPLQTTGDFFWADSAFTIANIFNLSNATVTGNILNFPHVTMAGSGATTLGTIGGSSPATLRINNNAAGLNGAPTSANISYGVHVGGLDDANVFNLMDAFGTGRNGYITFRSARGTSASFTASQSGDLLGFIGAVGATGANTFGAPAGANGGAFFGVAATENWASTTNGGAEIRFYTTPNATQAVAIAGRFQNSGGLSIGSGASDPGIGKVNTANGYASGGASGLSATKTVRASGGAADCTLIFTGGIVTGGSC